MASPNLSEIVTTTLRNRSGELADNVSKNNALLKKLSARGNVKPVSGGRTIVQELDYSENYTYTRYSGYETINIAPSDVFTAAEYEWKQGAVAVSISGLEELQNSGAEAIIDLLEARITNAQRTMANNVSNDLYSDGTANGGKQIGGLQLIVDPTPATGTVGGINAATWGFWRNVAFDATTDGGAAATSANITDYMNQVWLQIVRGTDRPDLIIADNNYFRLYWESLQAIQRITSSDSATSGFSSLMYMDAPVVFDGGFQGVAAGRGVLGTEGISWPTGQTGAGTNTMYFLNTNYLFWRPHRNRNMVPLDPDRFSVNQDAMVKLIAFAGNMTCSNRFLQGLLTD